MVGCWWGDKILLMTRYILDLLVAVVHLDWMTLLLLKESDQLR